MPLRPREINDTPSNEAIEALIRKSVKREIRRLNSTISVLDHGGLTGLSDDDHDDAINGYILREAAASVTDNALTRWDDTGGRNVQDSMWTLDDAGKLASNGGSLSMQGNNEIFLDADEDTFIVSFFDDNITYVVGGSPVASFSPSIFALITDMRINGNQFLLDADVDSGISAAVDDIVIHFTGGSTRMTLDDTHMTLAVILDTDSNNIFTGGGDIDTEGGDIILDADGDTLIDMSNGDDVLHLVSGGVALLKLITGTQTILGNDLGRRLIIDTGIGFTFRDAAGAGQVLLNDSLSLRLNGGAYGMNSTGTTSIGLVGADVLFRVSTVTRMTLNSTHLTLAAILDTDGNDIFTGGGNIDTEGGNILTGTGTIDTENGVIQSGGGVMQSEGGAIRSGTGAGSGGGTIDSEGGTLTSNGGVIDSQGGIIQSGSAAIDTEGGDFLAGGGDLDTETGDIRSGGGIIDSESGDILTGGGDLLLEGGVVDFTTGGNITIRSGGPLLGFTFKSTFDVFKIGLQECKGVFGIAFGGGGANQYELHTAGTTKMDSSAAGTFIRFLILNQAAGQFELISGDGAFTAPASVQDPGSTLILKGGTTSSGEGGPLRLRPGGGTSGNAAVLLEDKAGTEIARADENGFIVDTRLDINNGIALGVGATATLGLIGGSGPTAAAQSQWVEIDIGGTPHWIPVWV